MSMNDTVAVTRPVTAGIDWSSTDNVVCVVDEDGEPIERVTLALDKAGIARLVRVLQRYQLSGVGIERPDGPVVDALFAAGFTVYVIAPAQVKALRQRYGSAGNKDDRFDAYVLADTVRTDRRRLTPLQRDQPRTTVLRQLSRTRKDLQAHRLAVTNQLRAHLALALPGAVDLFSELDSAISRQFLTRYPTQDAVDRITVKSLSGWLVKVRYSGRTDPAVLYQRLTDAPRGATGPHGTALAGITRAYLATMAVLSTQIDVLEQQIADALDQHPDRVIFAGLPRVATLRTARLIGEIGDARGRFPTPTALACLAGMAPSTRRSGKSDVVSFRWSADKHLRDAVHDFAGDSRKTNPWAADLYDKARARGCDHPHAVRILGRAWIDIIWKCWTTHTPYQPDRHRALQHHLHQHQNQDQQQDQKQGG